MIHTHILWDFNGTLLDDVRTGIDSVNVLLGRRGLPLLSDESEYRDHFTFPITEYYRSLGFDFDAEPFEKLAPEWVEEYLRFVPSAGLYEGVEYALDSFHRAGASQIVISATERSMLGRQLAELGIADRFDGFVGLDNIHAASKVGLALEWVELHRPERALFIGDTTHDCEVARAVGSDCVLIAGGHQHRAKLEACDVPVFGNLREAADYVLKLGE